MSWLAPLGFLGLIGLIILIIIYIIKPNYQNKIISSTFVWKLSLKYKKNKIPLSKLRNILLFLCQVLIITIASMMLAQPFIDNSKPVSNEKVIIIDAGASMMTTAGTQTRFERAVQAAFEEVDKIWEEENGKVSIILAKETASYLVQQAEISAKQQVYDELNALIDPAKRTCTYGTSDITGAIKLSETVTAQTPNVEVVLLTDTEYIDAGKVVVKSVRDISDWNVAIVDVRAVLIENKYQFEVDVASYGKNADVRVYCEISGVNESNDVAALQADVRCTDNAVQTFVFGAAEFDELKDLYSYSHLYVRVEEDDSFTIDNTFYLYGGKKLPLRIQYCSSAPNNYFASAVMVLREQLKYRWDIEFVEVGKKAQEEEEPATEGFDIYIYEHTMPATIPTDGLVILANPDESPSNAGFRLGNVNAFYEEQPLSAGDSHPIMSGIKAEGITVTRYTTVTSYDEYTPILYCGNDPVMLVKDEIDQKIVLMPFSLNFSNLAAMLEFPMMMYNIIEHYIPSTVTDYVFDVNETINLGSRSEELYVVGNGVDTVITEFPGSILLVTPGVYTVTQTPISGEEIIENFYVKIPAVESNIVLQEDALLNPYLYTEVNTSNINLLLYFAIALVVLLFAEWWLHTREQY